MAEREETMRTMLSVFLFIALLLSAYQPLAAQEIVADEGLAVIAAPSVVSYPGPCAASASRSVAPGCPQADQDARFREAVMAVETTFQSGDVDRMIEYYAEDAVSMPPGFPASVGKEAIDADLRYFFDEFTLERDFTLVGFNVTGDTATRTGVWTQTLTPKAGGEPIVETGRCVLGFKQVDGEWKVAWEIWNTYEPIATE